MEKTNINFWINKETKAKFKKACAKEEKEMTVVLIELIRKYIK